MDEEGNVNDGGQRGRSLKEVGVLEGGGSERVH